MIQLQIYITQPISKTTVFINKKKTAEETN